MNSQFWITAWNERRTNFHQGNYHDKLIGYFAQLNPKRGKEYWSPMWEINPKELYKAAECQRHIYDAALNNFARPSMSAALASPITK